MLSQATQLDTHFNKTTVHTQKDGSSVMVLDRAELQALKNSIKLENNASERHRVYTAIHNEIFSPLVSPKHLKKSVTMFLAYNGEKLYISRSRLSWGNLVPSTVLTYAIIETPDIV